MPAIARSLPALRGVFSRNTGSHSLDACMPDRFYVDLVREGPLQQQLIVGPRCCLIPPALVREDQVVMPGLAKQNPESEDAQPPRSCITR